MRRIIVLMAIVCLLGAGGWYALKRHGGSTDDDGAAIIPWSSVSTGAASGESVYERAERIGVIDDRRLNELSGITASRRTDNVWWVHNDSDDLPRLFAVDSTGKVLGEFRVPGAINEDWEDISSGPGADGSPALYIGDIGDNFLKREAVVIYRIKEPDALNSGEKSETDGVEPFQLAYPDGPHNAEALIIDPQNGRIYVVTKTDSKPCEVFRSPVPLKLGEKMMFEPVIGDAGPIIAKWRKVTGAAAAPDGSRIVIRTYFSAFELVRAAGKDFDSVFSAAPQSVTLPLEQQGEAISYSRDGKSLVTTSEKLPAPIYQMKRKQ